MTRILTLLAPLALAPALLAQDPEPSKPEAPKRESTTSETRRQESWSWSSEEGSRRNGRRVRTQDTHRHSFGWSLQGSLPNRDFKERLDETGYGIGMQWNSWDGDHIVHRTRLEMNTWKEGAPLGPAQLRTQTRNVLFSFDRLFPLRTSGLGPYVAIGLGGARWTQTQTAPAGPERSYSATKLVVMAGLGFQFTPNIGLEGRYNAGGLDKTLDSTHVQVAMSVRF